MLSFEFCNGVWDKKKNRMMGLPGSMGGARGWQGGAAAPVPSYVPQRLPPTCQNNDFRCPTGVFQFFGKKQLNVLKFLV